MSVPFLPRVRPAFRRASYRLSVPCIALLLAGCAGEPAAFLTTGALPLNGEREWTGLQPPGSGTRALAGKANAVAPSTWSAATAPVSPTLPPPKAASKRRGLDALAAGNVAEAERHLRRAIDAKAADWHVHSALGVALAGQGKHQAAQKELARALVLAPEHPSVLNNLALSYALDGKLDAAEDLLRRSSRGANTATARKNLALLLGARGKLNEARQILTGALPEPEQRPTLAYLSSLTGVHDAAPPSAADAGRTSLTRIARRDGHAFPGGDNTHSRHAEPTTVTGH